MRWIRNIILAIAVALSYGITLKAGNEGKVDVGEILFGHIGDSYGWHITEWNGRHISVPLPCIVRSSTGWHIFMSSRLEHGHTYEGLFIAEEGKYEGKIVEYGTDGGMQRPFDISITKNVASLIFTAVLLIV